MHCALLKREPTHYVIGKRRVDTDINRKQLGKDTYEGKGKRYSNPITGLDRPRGFLGSLGSQIS